MTRRSIAIGTGAAAAAVITHGAVLSAVNFDVSSQVSTYREVFQEALVKTELLWSYAHGWPPMSHVRDFGGFYAPLVQFLCPLFGFALFWLISRHQVGIQFWKPLAIAALFTIPRGYIALVPADVIQWVEAARAGLIVLLMIWSVGAIRLSRTRFSTAPA